MRDKHKKPKWFLVVGSCILLLTLASCKSNKNGEDLIVPAPKLYTEAMYLLAKGKYKDAAHEFHRVYAQHPGAELASKAQLMEAYTLFLEGEYEESAGTLDLFYTLHPADPYCAYALYLKGMNYYMQVEDIDLDQSNTSRAKEVFEQLIARFPDTKYATDARMKMCLLDDHMAGKELEVARYYLFKKQPIAAVNRAKCVINSYQNTAHTQEALYRIAQGYKMLGIKDEASKYIAVLGYNYPRSAWYKKGYELIREWEENNNAKVSTISQKKQAANTNNANKTKKTNKKTKEAATMQ